MGNKTTSFHYLGRVEASSLRSPKRLPRLVLLRSHQAPMALTLPDGSVQVNRAAIQVTYEGVEISRGDARMAFLLGHELAHLTMDDFWQAEAFSDVQKMPELGDAKRRLEQLLDRTDPDRGGRASRLRELQADAHGIITMSAAGYEPDTVLDGNSSFFRIWSTRVMELGKSPVANSAHPSDAERAALLRSQLLGVRSHLLVFDMGTKLLQLGRYEDARILFEDFRNRFPGRAVFNNLGLTEYQLAIRELAVCDPRRVVRYLTAIAADLETLGNLTRGGEVSTKRMGDARCMRLPAFQTPYRRALSYFNKASIMDPDYIPVRVNLSSALLIGGDPAGAMNAAEQVLRLVKGDHQALNNKAATLHDFGLQIDMDTTDRAIGLLERILDRHPDYAPAAYNLAVLLSDRKRTAAAADAWRRLLRYELPPLYRKEILRNLGRPVPRETPLIRVHISPSHPLGKLTSSSRQKLENMYCVSVRAGDFKARACFRDELQLLVIGDSVELVSMVPGSDLGLQLKRLYFPYRSESSGGWQTQIFHGLLVDTHTEGARRAWWFMPQRR